MQARRRLEQQGRNVGVVDLHALGVVMRAADVGVGGDGRAVPGCAGAVTVNGAAPVPPTAASRNAWAAGATAPAGGGVKPQRARHGAGGTP